MRIGIKDMIGGGGISDDFNQAASGLFLPKNFDPAAPAKPAAPARRDSKPAAEAQTATKVTAPTFDFSKKKKKDG